MESVCVLNQRNNFGENALMVLCHWSRNENIVETARFLLAQGTDANQSNEDGNNSLETTDVYRKNYRGKAAVDLLNDRPEDQVPNRSQILKLIQQVRMMIIM